MKVVLVHNRYLERGGEDEVFETELQLLQRRGVGVIPVVAQTRVPKGALEICALAGGCVWSLHWYTKIRRLVERFRPDIVHVHNVFPVISPSLYHACHDAGVAVVQTLHNYRLLCARATLYRAGGPCEECLDFSSWRSVRYGCYRESRLQSALVSFMNRSHTLMGTWSRKVSLYVAPSDFARKLFIRSGLPPNQVVVKTHFVSPDPGQGRRAGGYALYVGRLSQEKGVEVLLDAWRRLSVPVDLHLFGDGPLERRVREESLRNPRIVVHGRASHEEIFRAMKSAAFVVFPSLCYETCGLVILEAFACGVPVVAFRLGTMAEVIDADRTGFHARPGDPDSLVKQVEIAYRAPDRLVKMAHLCRREFEAKYCEERGYVELMRIYRIACERSAAAHPDHGERSVVLDVEGRDRYHVEPPRSGIGARS